MKNKFQVFLIIAFLAGCASEEMPNKLPSSALCVGDNDGIYALTDQYFKSGDKLTVQCNVIHITNGKEGITVSEAYENVALINKRFAESGANIVFEFDKLYIHSKLPREDSTSLNAIRAIESIQHEVREDLRSSYHIYHFHFWVDVFKPLFNQDRFYIYIFDHDDDGWAGVAEKIGTHHIAVRRQYWREESATPSHEIGHAFGLLHTHEDDPTNGLTNTTGDKVCDTPFTPKEIAKFVSNGCEYKGSGLEGMDVECISRAMINLMSYNINHCRYEFTPVQVERMYKTIETNSDLRNCIKELRSPRLTSVKKLNQ